MKFWSAQLTAVSGSIGGATYSHNKGGMYIRARGIPTNPNTPQQQAVRGILADLANRWTQTLTLTQRNGWKAYADNVKVPDAFGQLRYVTPLNHYIRSNVPPIQKNGPGARKDTAPSEFNVGSFSNPSVKALSSTQMLEVAFLNTDEWAIEAGASMLIYTSKLIGAGIEYFKGPYRLLGQIIGNAAPPPTSPWTMAPGFTLVAGQKVYFRVVVSRLDGRLSYPFLVGCVST